jgi:hypothetical protein
VRGKWNETVFTQYPGLTTEIHIEDYITIMVESQEFSGTLQLRVRPMPPLAGMPWRKRVSIRISTAYWKLRSHRSDP